MSLDIASNQALKKGRPGVSQDLADQEEVQIPDYFEFLDPRKKPEQWVEERFNSRVREMFEARHKIE